MRNIFALAGTALLLGCGAGPAVPQRAFLASLVGQSEAGAVQRLGMPSAVYQQGDERFLSYDEGAVAAGPGGPALPGCRMTLAVARGTVQSWTLNGPYCTAGSGKRWLPFGV